MATLTELMLQYADVFQDPKNLPPCWKFDHIIILKHVSQPVNANTYRYALVQKNVIKDMIKEMLSSGVIRNSTTPFSSPVFCGEEKRSNLKNVCGL